MANDFNDHEKKLRLLL